MMSKELLDDRQTASMPNERNIDSLVRNAMQRKALICVSLRLDAKKRLARSTVAKKQQRLCQKRYSQTTQRRRQDNNDVTSSAEGFSLKTSRPFSPSSSSTGSLFENM